MPIRILYAEDHTLVREAIVSLMHRDPELLVVGQASDGFEAIRLAGRLQPDLVVLDLAMPGLDGFETAREIKRRYPAMRVLPLTVANCELKAAEAFAAGADGYLTKSIGCEALVSGIKAVAAGTRYVAAGLSLPIVERLIREGPERGFEAALTTRELQILKLIAQGIRNREIATELHISPKTVDTHRTKLMRKLNLRSAAKLANFAVRNGLVDN